MQISEFDIRTRAYLKYLENPLENDRDIKNWLEAENELLLTENTSPLIFLSCGGWRMCISDYSIDPNCSKATFTRNDYDKIDIGYCMWLDFLVKKTANISEIKVKILNGPKAGNFYSAQSKGDYYGMNKYDIDIHSLSYRKSNSGPPYDNINFQLFVNGLAYKTYIYNLIYETDTNTRIVFKKHSNNYLTHYCEHFFSYFGNCKNGSSQAFIGHRLGQYWYQEVPSDFLEHTFFDGYWNVKSGKTKRVFDNEPMTNDRDKTPSDILPHDGLVVTAPPAFSWSPAPGTGGVYLNVSTVPDFKPINVINWHDDGTHYYRGTIEKFKNLIGSRLYWRLVYDGVPTPTRTFVVGDWSVDPYYNAVHFGWPGEGPWNPDPPKPDESVRTKITASPLEELKSSKYVGTVGDTPDRKLAVSYHIPYFNTGDIEHYKSLVTQVLDVCKDARVPILLGLDGYEYWGGRPDLWMWWDDSHPKNNPDNKYNVEWTSWSSADAVNGNAFRNWGSPSGVGAPHPNISSPKVIAAQLEALDALVPIIADWYNSLDSEDKWLLAGVKIGWELSIGVNYYYPKGSEESYTNGHQLGYATVKTAGLASSGPLDSEQITTCVQNYLRKLTERTYRNGIPRQKIFTHVCAHKSPPECITCDAALSEFGIPGWSFYTMSKDDPGLKETLDRLGEPDSFWSNIEWGGQKGGSCEDWCDAYLTFEQHRNNKLIASWGGGQGNDGSALSKIINITPRLSSGRHHWMHPPNNLRSATNGQDVTLSWDAPSQAEKVYLNVSTSAEMTVGGVLLHINAANADVTGMNTWRLSLSSGEYYWMLVADGYSRRVPSEMHRFTVL